MFDVRGDQAEGLRRIFSFSHARTIAVVSGNRGAGATSCVLNLASALARQGKRVLIVDENSGSGSVSQALGLRPRFDLKNVIADECTLGEALMVAGSLTVLAASRAARTLSRLDSVSQARALDCFAQLDEAADIVLLDARNDAVEPSAFAMAAQEVIVVVSPGSPSITGGYAAVKSMHRTHGRKRFQILVNRANDETAPVVYSNMAQVAKKHLDVALDYMGAVPQDMTIAEAAACFATAVDATPYSGAARRFSEHAGAIARWTAPQDDASRLDSFMQRAIYGSRLFAAGAGA